MAYSLDSFLACRQVFPQAVLLANRAAEYLASKGPAVAVDMDNVAQRVTVDVIGHMVFLADFGATDFEKYNEPLEIISNVLRTLQLKLFNPLSSVFPFDRLLKVGNGYAGQLLWVPSCAALGAPGFK